MLYKNLLIEFLLESLSPYILLELLLFIIKNFLNEIKNNKIIFSYNKIKWFLSSKRITIIIYRYNFNQILININFFLKRILKNTFKKIILYLKEKKNIININLIFPINNIFILNNFKIIKIKINSLLTTSSYTYSNIIISKKIKILHPYKYYSILYKHKVNIDLYNRKNNILFLLKNIEYNKKIIINKNKKILYFLILLLEWPTISIIKINKEYLKLPKQILIYVINKFKCLYTYKNNINKISPYIVIISECLSNNHKFINKNYKSYINNKFLDIKRLINEDIKYKLVSYLPKLKNIIYQNNLGNLYDKIKRIFYIFKKIYKKFNIINKKEFYNISSFICYYKNDYATKLVNEYKLFNKITAIYYLKIEKNFFILKYFNDYYYYINNIYFKKNIFCKLFTNSLLIFIDYFDYFIGIIFTNNNYIKKIFKKKDPYGLKKIILIIIKTIIYNKINIDIVIFLKIVLNIFIKKFINNKNIIKINNFNINIIYNFIYKRYIIFVKKEYLINITIINKVNDYFNFNKNNILLLHNFILFFNKEYISYNFKSLILFYKRINNLLNKQNKIKIILNEKINIKLLNKFEYSLYIFIKKNINKYFILYKNKNYKKILFLFYKIIKPFNKYLDIYHIFDNNIKITINRLLLINKIKKFFLKFINLTKI